MKIIRAAALAVLALVNLIAPFAARADLSARAAPAAYADGGSDTYSGYGYVDLGAEVAFCTEKDGASMLFSVPETYCVKVLYQDGDWLRVSYAADADPYRELEGYVLPTGLIFSDTAPETPYLNLTFKVVYTPATDSGYLPGLEDMEFDAAYYGAYTVGTQSYSYVRCNGKFGYVSKSITNVPKNPLPSKPTMTDPQDPPARSSNTTVVVAVALAALAAAVVAVLFFTSRKPKQP